ncbi:MAG: SMC-Scp complex subunit ScpB [Pseudomonadota bacterium]|nr:SMC-Scp complex subunit ScpB [Pseudomonadota bacterium]
MSSVNATVIKDIVEAALMASDRPLTVERLMALFEPDGPPDSLRDDIERALVALAEDYAGRGIEIVRVARGYRVQTRADLSTWINRLWEDRPPRYSRALLETLAIIAYRQPITRGEIEALRGVAVSTGTLKTLLEREWVRLAGHRDVPGRPAVYATTPQFLEYFNLRHLSELPLLGEPTGTEQLQLALTIEAELERETVE